MFRSICKSKIASARVTQTELYYEGSITIDKDLLDAVDIVAGEKVDVLNMNNGTRIETYAIEGKSGSGQICLNGAAARLGYVGDQVIILSYGLVDSQEAKTVKMKLVHLGQDNKIKK